MAEMMTPNGLVVGLIAKPAQGAPKAVKPEVKASAPKAKPAAAKASKA